jgi:prepilin-type processing-associated H-X9-DG protein
MRTGAYGIPCSYRSRLCTRVNTRGTGGMPSHNARHGNSRHALQADGHAPSAQLSRLGKMHMDGTGALLPFFNIECDSKALMQRLECRAFDPRSMEEDLAPIISRDESKSALLHHPFDFPRCHDVALSHVRVVSCRPFPTSTVMHTLQPFTQPICGEGTIQSARHRWIVCPPPPAFACQGRFHRQGTSPG